MEEDREEEWEDALGLTVCVAHGTYSPRTVIRLQVFRAATMKTKKRNRMD